MVQAPVTGMKIQLWDTSVATFSNFVSQSPLSVCESPTKLRPLSRDRPIRSDCTINLAFKIVTILFSTNRKHKQAQSLWENMF